MATTAQKKALQQTQTTLDNSRTAQAASRAAYNRAQNNYTALANKGYQQSAATKGLFKKYNKTTDAAQAILDKGVGYKNKYDEKITSLLDRAENGKMQYSVTDDPAYKALQNTYVNQGRTAMQNAVGEAVAATGGYGSTAAAAAGQVAYNQSLTELNGHVAGLYDAAAARFNNKQNLLVTLADSYRQLDAQGWEQAKSEWDSKFNGYMQLADEYLKGYEYLDEADRKAYETRLDAYWNNLTSAQSQYNTDQSMTQQAQSAYNQQTNEMANYDETVRRNLANEALERSKLEETKRANRASEAETRRVNDAQIAAQKQKNTSSLAPTERVQSIIHATEHPNFDGRNYKINGKSCPYSKNELVNFINGNGNKNAVPLTDEEAQFLIDYYDL